jgi:DNA-binding beta-propeller fold protein YncE
MAMEPAGDIELPAHSGPGGFDHGDVHQPTGRVFIAHTANGTIEVLDGEQLRHAATLPDCPEASGVLCPGSTDLVVAAARGAGVVHFMDTARPWLRSRVAVGGRPNGLAWDSRRQRVLVADVAGNSFAIVDPSRGQIVATTPLPGRPRWAAYDADRDRFLVNVRDPALVALVDAETGGLVDTWSVSSPGPHGLDLDGPGGRVFVACDGGDLICLGTSGGRELGTVQIAGEPDAIWFDAATDSVYVAIGSPGVVQVIDAGRMAVHETAVTEEGATTTALDTRRRLLYVFKPTSCSAAVFRLVSPP